MARWPRRWVEQQTANLKTAAVLMPVIERPLGLTLLLTRRARAMKHHAGQVAFPGGRMEPVDKGVGETALRETHEEVGIAPGDVRPAGYLAPMLTVTGYAVTPVIGFVAPDVRLTLDPVEVERAFEVPIEFLFDAENERWSERDVNGQVLPVVEFGYAGERIWGATALMILSLKKHYLSE